MLTRGKVLLLTILCLLSLVSIGFASWTITESDEEIVYGSMHTDNVINSADFIRLDTSKGEQNTGISCFNYKETGYLAEDGINISNYGYIYTYYILDLENCFKMFGEDYSSITITLNLGYGNGTLTNLNLFDESNDDTKHSISSTYVVDVDSINHEKIEIDESMEKQYSIKINFIDVLNNNNSDLLKEISFSVKYTLYSPTNEYFYREIFTYLYMDMITVVSFKVDAFVQGYN